MIYSMDFIHSSLAADAANWIFEVLSYVPSYLLVMLISMMPIIELRGTILLWGAGEYGFELAGFPYKEAWLKIYLFAVAGNIIPVPFLLAFFPRAEKWFRRWDVFDSFFNWIFERTRRKASASVQKRGSLALLLFVAIPLPVTGAWTGTLVSYLFGLDKKMSFIFIFLGILIAGGIMLTMVLISFLWAVMIIILLTVLLALVGRMEKDE